MKKRFYSLLFVCLLMFAFTGCSKKEEPVNASGETSQASEAAEADETEEIDGEDGFVTFVDPKGAFSVDFPGTPEENVEKVSLGAEEVEAYAYFLQLSETAYNVMYSDYPEGYAADQEAVLENALASVPAPIEESTDITMGDYIGKEVRYTLQSGSQSVAMYHRIYLVGDRMYQLQAMNSSGERDAQFDVFFDSFVLTQ